MKRERRRSVRVSVRIPVSLRFQNGEAEHGSILGLSEGGISVELSLQMYSRFSNPLRHYGHQLGWMFSADRFTLFRSKRAWNCSYVWRIVDLANMAWMWAFLNWSLVL
jgi:hypothetical protein